MPINYPQFRALSAAEMGGLGGLDLAGALRSGLQNAKSIQEARYRPQQLQQEQHARELANKINEAKAQYAEQNEAIGLKQKEAQITHLAAQTALSQGNLGLIPYYKKLYSMQAAAQEAKINQAKQQQDLYSQLRNGVFGDGKSNQMQEQPEPNQANQSNDYISMLRGQEVPQGQGALMPQQINMQSERNNQLPGGINKEDILRGLTYKAFGLTPPSAHKEPTEKDRATTEYMQKRANSFAYSTAPVDTKTYMIAQAAGMGIAPDKAINSFAEGKTVADLAKENGFDSDNLPEPDFSPTKGNITKLNERKAALGEMKHLSNFVIEGLGPYSETVLGWSPEQTINQLRGMDKQKQIKFIAARGIVPELTNMRLMTAGAKNTVHAIKSMQDKSLLNIKGLQSGVKPDVWASAQRLMDKELEQAMKASMSKFKLKTKSEREAEQHSEEGKVTVRNKKTGQTETISISEARKRGVPNV